mmetsp:Transcript_1777/g.1924  ORF Transcript_1777/g.1924 Transcript_1777/m.1924 type:complete len:277 (-) Transcript_1777:841-1671(-)
MMVAGNSMYCSTLEVNLMVTVSAASPKPIEFSRSATKASKKSVSLDLGRVEARHWFRWVGRSSEFLWLGPGVSFRASPLSSLYPLSSLSFLFLISPLFLVPNDSEVVVMDPSSLTSILASSPPSSSTPLSSSTLDISSSCSVSANIFATEAAEEVVTMLSSNGDGDVHRVGGGATNPAPRSTEDDDAVTVDVIIADKPAAVDLDPLVVIDDDGNWTFDVDVIVEDLIIFTPLPFVLVWTVVIALLQLLVSALSVETLGWGVLLFKPLPSLPISSML